MTRNEIDDLMRENGIVVVGEAVYALCQLVAASEREECAKIEEKLACSPAMFATMAQYRVHKDAVIAYRNLILARGQSHD